MKDFLKKYKVPIIIVIIIEICLIPFEVLLFYQNRDFVDLGMLISAILLIIVVVPIYNLIKRNTKMEKEISIAKEKNSNWGACNIGNLLCKGFFFLIVKGYT